MATKWLGLCQGKIDRAVVPSSSLRVCRQRSLVRFHLRPLRSVEQGKRRKKRWEKQVLLKFRCSKAVQLLLRLQLRLSIFQVVNSDFESNKIRGARDCFVGCFTDRGKVMNPVN